MAPQTTVILDGLQFTEGPRWHEGKLWFSDMGGGRVLNVDLEGNFEHVVDVPGYPSGIGWNTDGDLLVVSMDDQKLMQLANGKLYEVAERRYLGCFTLGGRGSPQSLRGWQYNSVESWWKHSLSQQCLGAPTERHYLFALRYWMTNTRTFPVAAKSNQFQWTYLVRVYLNTKQLDWYQLPHNKRMLPPCCGALQVLSIVSGKN